MNILIIGANGKTGRALVLQACDRGHRVTAFAHHPPKRSMVCARVVCGDARDRHLILAAVAGQDAVIDTVGTRRPFLKTALETDVAQNLVVAMQRQNVRRIIAISSLGVGDSVANVPLLYRALMPIFFRGALPDKEGMESQIRSSGLDWTIVRPAGLTDGSSTGIIKIVEPQTGHVRRIARADVAAFILNHLAGSDLVNKTVGIATE